VAQTGPRSARRLATGRTEDLKVKAAKGEYLGILEERKIRFEDFALEYLVWSQANKAERTYKVDQHIINRRLIPFFQGNYLASIKPKAVEDYKTHRLSTIQPRTVNRELAALRSMFTRAIEWQYVKAHPMANVKELKFQKRPPVFLTPDQLDQLLEVCRQPHLYAFVALAAHTGLRKSEVFNLKWADVDFKRSDITVRQSKNNEYRIIPMNELVRATLKKHPRHITSDLVLAHGDGTAYQRVDKAFHNALENAGLPRIRIHDLRHSFASNLIIAGVPLNVAQELLGHKDIKMTMVYTWRPTQRERR
jgi:integrase